MAMMTRAKALTARTLGGVLDLDSLVGRPGRRYVFAYHRVISEAQAAADGMHNSLWISAETFRSQLRWMRRIGDIVDCATVVTSSELNQRPWFALTFDDGWRDNFDIAFPILKSEQAPATVFLVSDAVESDSLFWTQDVEVKTRRAIASNGIDRVRKALAAAWPQAPRFDDLPVESVVSHWVEALKLVSRADRSATIEVYLERIGQDPAPLKGYLMSWAQAREMHREQVTFGSHTHTHEILEGLDRRTALAECMTSKALIEQRLGIAVDAFCYPNARFLGDEGPLLEQAGYRYAFAINGRRARPTSPRYFVPRFLASEDRVVAHDSYRLHLLEVPLFAGRPHRPSKRRRSEG